MKLYHSPTSPYVRKIMVLLHETGQLDDVELLPAHGTPLDSSNMPLAHNPLGKVPTLVCPGRPALYDSRVIARYFDARTGDNFYPAHAIWETLTLEATAEGIIDAALLLTYENRLRPENRRMPEFAEGQWIKIARACETVNAQWMGHLAKPVNMSHITLGCALGYVDFRHGDRDWRTGCADLAAWYREFHRRPSMQATEPPQGA
ncbi:MAG: glutathione S-transferase [Pseudomonadota bacterium]